MSEATKAGINQFEKFGLPPGTKSGNADRRAILEENHLLRQGRLDKPRNFEFAGVALRIPEMDYKVIQAMFPDVNSKDHEIRTRAWQAFANSPAGEPYRVHRKARGEVCRSITAR